MNVERLIEALDDQWWYVELQERDDVQVRETVKPVYIGMIRAIESLGYDWKRDMEGHHKVFGGAK